MNADAAADMNTDPSMGEGSIENNAGDLTPYNPADETVGNAVSRLKAHGISQGDAQDHVLRGKPLHKIEKIQKAHRANDALPQTTQGAEK